MFLTTFVLISVDGKHDSLEKRVDFGHCDQTTEVCDMSGLGLEEEEKITIFLRLFVVREEALL